MRFSVEPLSEIIAWLTTECAQQTLVSCQVSDPDLHRGHYAGQQVEYDGVQRMYRPLRSWLDLADILECRLLVPERLSGGWLQLTFERLQNQDWQHDKQATRHNLSEKYGASSGFDRICKLEDPHYWQEAQEALERLSLPHGARILDVGVNHGEELALFEHLQPQVMGLDHSESALAAARRRYQAQAPRIQFEVMDINTLPQAHLGRFDLIFSVGTLQSPEVNADAVFRALLREHLAVGGRVLLGFPNCRYQDGEIRYGARMRNFRKPELSLLFKDIAFYRRHLQKHGFKVFVTGKYYIWITAVALHSG